jgi:hypothetical protein
MVGGLTLMTVGFEFGGLIFFSTDNKINDSCVSSTAGPSFIIGC